MTDTVADWVDLVHERYPPAHAAEWDRVGLQVGDPAWPVARVLVALDVTSAVIAEAADGPPTLVAAHHPLLFRPLTRLTPDTAAGRVALAAASARVAVLAAHTNLDVATDGAGTSEPIMRALGITDAAPLTSEADDAGQVKLVTFVPPDHVGVVLDALAAAGAGVIGAYERCSFRVRGTGTFRPGQAAAPYSGQVGVDNEEVEERLEIVVPHARLGAAVAALWAAHPYDEVAYDLHPLLAPPRAGFGRVGTLAPPVPLVEVAERVRERLPAPSLRFAGAPDHSIRMVAAVGGSGGRLVEAALTAGADVLITGDLGHHPVLDALERGLALIDAGHHATEHAAMGPWLERLQEAARQRSLSAELLASTVSTAPWAG
ncbi:MAG TPA: Nif3-like dinuclear metal center hexameric protein [Nitriliruptorales bacterium]|nr:Nif3-like dinuclear metal center hexameric protein [Nitriliruptorales bacterium]